MLTIALGGRGLWVSWFSGRIWLMIPKHSKPTYTRGYKNICHYEYAKL